MLGIYNEFVAALRGNHIEEFCQAKEETKQTSESELSNDKSTTQEAPHDILAQKQIYPQNSARLKF